MELTVLRSDDAVTHVKLTGRLDDPGVNEVALHFTRNTVTRRKPSLVDLSAVDFITSLGMGMLVGNAQALRRFSVVMVIVDPQPRVEAALNAAGINQIIPIAHGLEEAERLLRE